MITAGVAPGLHEFHVIMLRCVNVRILAGVDALSEILHFLRDRAHGLVTEGIEDFQAYEDAVLPLLPEFNGRLERRLRNQDGTAEMHIVSFASDEDFQNYRNDPRRVALARLLEKIICEAGIASNGYNNRVKQR